MLTSLHEPYQPGAWLALKAEWSYIAENTTYLNFCAARLSQHCTASVRQTPPGARLLCKGIACEVFSAIRENSNVVLNTDAPVRPE